MNCCGDCNFWYHEWSDLNSRLENLILTAESGMDRVVHIEDLKKILEDD